MWPYAYGDGQKFKHGLHGEHGFGFFTDFFLKTVFFGFIFRFSWIRECLWHSLFLKSIRYHSIEYITLSYTKKEVPQHLQIQINQKQNPRIIGSIISKNESVKRPIRVKSVLSVFHFLICVPAEGWGHNDNTEKTMGLGYMGG